MSAPPTTKRRVLPAAVLCFAAFLAACGGDDTPSGTGDADTSSSGADEIPFNPVPGGTPTSTTGGMGGTQSTGVTAATGGLSADGEVAGTGGTPSAGGTVNTGGAISTRGSVSVASGGSESALTGGHPGTGGAVPDVDTPTENCIAGTQTGDTCDPEVDVVPCERSDRTCLCMSDGTWECTDNDVLGESTCVAGVQTADPCDPVVDTEDCVRSDRVCICLESEVWDCDPL
jgi:hypothetical protein